VKKLTSNLPFVIFYYVIGLIISYNYVKVEAEGLKDKVLTVLAVMNMWPFMMSAAVYKSTKNDKAVF